MAAGILLGTYLLGSVSFSYLVVRILRREDVRRLGSGNAGATNVYRVAGAAPAAAALLLDVGKGVAAVVLSRWLEAPMAVVGAAAVAVVLGHSFPVFLGFRGGKGVATSIGAFAVLAPEATLATLATFVVVVAWRRYVSLGSMVGAALFPGYVYLFGEGDGGFSGAEGEGWLLVAAVALAVLVLALHGHNFHRLRQGSEPRLEGWSEREG